MDRGEPVTPIFALLRANVRVPDAILGDVRAQLAACDVGRRRLVELVEIHGKETFAAACIALLDRSEALTRQRLAAIPDGTYRFTDFMDDDGVRRGVPVRIAAAVTVAGSDVRVDFMGTNPQLAGPFNCVRSSTLAAVYYTVRAVTGPDIPNNSGCYRPIAIIAPKGSMVNPEEPAPVNARTASVRRIVDTLMGCFVQAMPGKLPAASCGQLLVMSFGGTDPATGRAFVTSELLAGGMGGRPGLDGIDGIETDATNCMNIPAEALETESPLRVEQWTLWPDSAGAGTWRGGLGVYKVFAVTRGSVTASYRGERHTTQPWGVLGGRPAANSRAWVQRANGRVEPLTSKQMVYLETGDGLHVHVSGGGGFGDPRQRAPEAVAADVRDGYVSREAAGSAYGVMSSDGGGDVSPMEARLRRRSRRSKQLWLFDRGVLPDGAEL